MLPFGEQRSLLCRSGRTTLGWESHESSQHECTLDVRPLLLGMSVTSLCSPLGSNPAWQRSLKTTLVLLRISPLDWTYFRLKTATFEILINDKLPPELSLLASRRATPLTKSETWPWRHQFSVSRLNGYLLTEYIYNVLRHRKLSLICISKLLE